MKKVIYLLLLVILPGLSAQAQTVYKDQVRVENQSITRSDDNRLTIAMDIIMQANMKISSNRSATLTPILEANGHTKALSPVVIYGRRRALVNERGNTVPKDAFVILRRKRKTEQRVSYLVQLPYEAWMQKANLVMDADLCGCRNIVEANTLDPIATLNIERIKLQPAIAYITPKAEEVKHRAVEGSAFLDFPVNKTIIYPEYRRNQAELAKIRATIDTIRNDKNISITGIRLEGYASPEGSVPSNCRLSEGRAATLKNYLTPRLHNNQLPMFSESGCEDWKGTIELLERSDIDGRDLLLDAIRKCDHSDAAEIGLRTLAGGIPYTAMLHEIYPKVRRVVCSVDYTVREFTIEEGRRIINEHPELLSMYEMHQIAFSYPGNSPEFLDAFRTAERIYPQNEIALLNGAIVALADGDTEKAAANLQKVTMHNPVCLNAQGILLARQGKKEEAKECFRQAMEEGLDVAKHNLSELEKTMK